MTETLITFITLEASGYADTGYAFTKQISPTTKLNLVHSGDDMNNYLPQLAQRMPNCDEQIVVLNKVNTMENLKFIEDACELFFNDDTNLLDELP